MGLLKRARLVRRLRSQDANCVSHCAETNGGHRRGQLSDVLPWYRQESTGAALLKLRQDQIR